MRMQKRKLRIGDLAAKLGVKHFVVRFWEKEFAIQPHRSHGNQRFYDEKDHQKFTLIKELLYQRQFTIAGAKNYLKEFDKPVLSPKPTIGATPNHTQTATLPHETTQLMVHLQKKLLQLRKLL